MKDYIRIKEIEENIEFINFAISCKNIDAKSSNDMKRLCNELNFNFENLTSNIQIHSDIVNVINKNSIGEKIEGDALITNLSNVPLLIFTADCVPIAMIDKKNKAIGLAHAGWRGTFDKISKNTLESMKKEYNTNFEDVVCIIGPSIGPCCYEVSKELIEKFNTNITKGYEKSYIIKDGKYYLNLWKINEQILNEIGVKKENIINLELCTSCNEQDFHSYRKHEKTSKRIGMILQIK